MSLSGRLMSGKGQQGRLDSFQMTFYTGPVAFAALVPFAIARERAVCAEALRREPTTALGFLLGSAAVALLYNVTMLTGHVGNSAPRSRTGIPSLQPVLDCPNLRAARSLA